jgi:hypothetical protein
MAHQSRRLVGLCLQQSPELWLHRNAPQKSKFVSNFQLYYLLGNLLCIVRIALPRIKTVIERDLPRSRMFCESLHGVKLR